MQTRQSTNWADGAAGIAHVMEARITKTGDAGVFEAVISTYGIDRDNERVAPGALTASIARLKAAGRNLPVLGAAHTWNQPEAICGYIKAADIRETPRGIEVTGQIDLTSQMGQATWAAMKARTLNEWSIGMADVTRYVDASGVSVITEATLVEVSACMIGVNPSTGTTSMKATALEDFVEGIRHDHGSLTFFAGGSTVRGGTVFEHPAFAKYGTDLVAAASKALALENEVRGTHGSPPVKRAVTVADCIVDVQAAGRRLDITEEVVKAAVQRVILAGEQAERVAQRAVGDFEQLHGVKRHHELEAEREAAAKARRDRDREAREEQCARAASAQAANRAAEHAKPRPGWNV